MNSEFTDHSIMKNVYCFCVFHVVVVGVFGESVSVMEGDSATLQTGLSEIPKDDVIEWRYGVEGNLLAQINNAANKISIYDEVLNGRFRNRLKLDNITGDLTVRNIRTETSGLYELTNNYKLNKMFNVSAVSVDEVKLVLVMVGETVTLHTDLTDVQTVDMIQWRFQHQISSIAKINRKDRKVSYDNPDERFKHQLHLDYLTGSLTIRNIGISHSGFYVADINTARHTIHKMFNVTVSGEKKQVSVMEGQPAFLQTGLTEILLDAYIVWMFADTVIAEIRITQPKYEDADKRLQIDKQTGSLTINECKISDSGLYDLKISNNRHTVHQRFIVTVSVPALSSVGKAMIGGVVFLLIGVVVFYFHRRNSKVKDAVKSIWLKEDVRSDLQSNAQLQKGNTILWTFGQESTLIAEVKGTGEIIHYDGPDGRFRDRLMLDKTTGDLTITNTRTELSGDYKLKIRRKTKTTFMTFQLLVFDNVRPVSVMNKGSITLNTDTELQPDDEVLWKFADEGTVIAKTKGGTRESTMLHGPGGRFRNRLELDHQTGSLTITEAGITDSGQYKLEIITSRNTSVKLFIVTISDPAVFENVPEQIALL